MNYDKNSQFFDSEIVINDTEGNSLVAMGDIYVAKNMLVGNRVGIRNTNPSHSLDVNGSVFLNGDITVGGHVIPSIHNTFDLGTSDNRLRNLSLNNSLNIGDLSISTSDGNLSPDSPVVFSNGISTTAANNIIGALYMTNGNIGINTTTPTSALDIDGDFNIKFGNIFENGIQLKTIRTNTVAAGSSFSGVLSYNNEASDLNTWGVNSNGQLGNSNTNGSYTSINISGFGSISNKIVTKLVAGYAHFIALDNNGSVHTWGLNSSGQLGNDSTTSSTIPINISTSGSLSGKTITDVYAKGWNSIALDSTGKIHTWGLNSSGQLGNNSTTNSLLPVTITHGSLSSVTVGSISSGYEHTLVIDTSGKIHTWGLNSTGQLGNNSTTNSLIPINTILGSLGNNTVISIAGGQDFSIATAENGTLHIWGGNNYGQLGNNSTTNSLIPINITTMGSLGLTTISGPSSGNLITRSISKIYAGTYHSFGIDSIGDLHSWGLNDFGQLGNNTTTNSLLPINVTTIGSLNEKILHHLAAGENHTLAIDTNGIVYTWGANESGQLGDGTTNQSTSAISTKVFSIDFTGQHRCYINNIHHTEYAIYEGLIVVAKDNIYSNKNIKGNHLITINESLPVVTLSDSAMDKRVFGVISTKNDNINLTNDELFLQGDYRCQINSVGEGAIWVIDQNGNLNSGDYITSSSVPGYGMKQIVNPDNLCNYTVAKITIDCDFNPQDVPKKRLVQKNGNIEWEYIYDTTAYEKDENGNIIYDDKGKPKIIQLNVPVLKTEKSYKLRYLKNDGTVISEFEYNSLKSQGQNVFRAAFVGCTYHCG